MSEEKSFLGVSMTFWDGIQGLLAVVGAALAVGGIIWGVHEFRGKLEADRARETLNLLEVWETQGYLNNYRSLEKRIQEVLQQVPSQDITAAEKDSRMLSKLYEKVSNSVLGESGAQEEFEDLVYFFERLQICVDANLCSPKATNLFFEDTMASFALVFDRPLQDFRSGPPAFFISMTDQ